MTNRELYKYHLELRALKGTALARLFPFRIWLFETLTRRKVHRLLTQKDHIQKQFLCFKDGKVEMRKTNSGKMEPKFLLGKTESDFKKVVDQLMDKKAGWTL